MARDIISKEEWIDEVIGSVKGIQRAKPGADFFDKVSAGLSRPAKRKVFELPVKQWAAAAVILLALNICSVIYFTHESRRAAVPAVNNPFAIIQVETTYNY